MRLAVLEAVCQDPERESLDLRSRLFRACPVDEHTWQLRNIGYPAAVFLSLNFDYEPHRYTILLHARQLIASVHYNLSPKEDSPA